MLVPLIWLEEFVDITLPLKDLSHLLSMAGLEVDAIIPPADLSQGFVIAKVEAIEPHPDANRLSLVKVDDGEGGRVVVCGAKNMAPGDHVILAKPGATLPGGMVIKEAKIRGVKSAGMLCAAAELALFEDNAGLLILGDEHPPGTSAQDALPKRGPVLELGLTPNRSDCLSMEGIARDVAALTGGSYRTLKTDPKVSEGATPAAKLASVDNQATDGCPHYLGRVIEGVKVGPSPLWLQLKLNKAGIRSINNIVDSTNYVMMEIGQPLHAFDLDLLKGQRIVVRRAKDGEKLEFLDGETRKVDARDLMICDAEAPVALAGVMGGELSGVNDGTTRILLESAYFEPLTVRLSARRYGLHTESSHRFERGVNPQGQRRAIDRLAELILKVAGGQLSPGYIEGGPGAAEAPPIAVDCEGIRSLLGLDLDDDGIVDCLKRLDIQVETKGGQLQATPPRSRVDLVGTVDLAEEVARVHGYENIPRSAPVAEVRAPKTPPMWQGMRLLEDHLIQRGFSQGVTFTLVPPSYLDRMSLGEDDPRRAVVKLLKPLSEEMSILRPLLAPSLLQVAAHNINRQNADLSLFEVGRIFAPSALDVDSEEAETLGLLMTGRRYGRTWGSPGEESVDLYDLRGAIESLVEALKVEPVEFTPGCDEPWLVSARAWTLSRGGETLGVAGLVHPRVSAAFGLEAPMLVAEITLEPLLAASLSHTRTPALPIYPKVQRDLAVLVDGALAAGDALAHINSLGFDLIEEVRLFDIYEGKRLPEGKKSLAFSVSYRSPERTLTEGEVGEIHEAIFEALQSTFQAERR